MMQYGWLLSLPGKLIGKQSRVGALSKRAKQDKGLKRPVSGLLKHELPGPFQLQCLHPICLRCPSTQQMRPVFVDSLQRFPGCQNTSCIAKSSLHPSLSSAPLRDRKQFKR